MPVMLGKSRGTPAGQRPVSGPRASRSTWSRDRRRGRRRGAARSSGAVVPRPPATGTTSADDASRAAAPPSSSKSGPCERRGRAQLALARSASQRDAGEQPAPASRHAASAAVRTSATASPATAPSAAVAGEAGLERLDGVHRRGVDAVQQGEVAGDVVAQLHQREEPREPRSRRARPPARWPRPSASYSRAVSSARRVRRSSAWRSCRNSGDGGRGSRAAGWSSP